MEIGLREGVHAVVIGEDLVLLDVAADRYLCLPAALQTRADGGRHLNQEAVLWLREAGLAGGGSGGLPALARPTRGLPGADEIAPSPAERLRLILCLLDYGRMYLGKSFADVLAQAARGAPESPSGLSAETLRLAQVFEQLAVWAPVPRKCLARSFLLLRFLARSGVRGRWVFGVRTWPFAAHCWVQIDETVLDDAPDRLSRYVPILAL